MDRYYIVVKYDSNIQDEEKLPHIATLAEAAKQVEQAGDCVLYVENGKYHVLTHEEVMQLPFADEKQTA